MYLGEKEGEIAIDAVLLLEDTGGLDTFPGGGDLDQDAGLVDTDGLVKLQVLSAPFNFPLKNRGFLDELEENCIPQ